jgi:hypothetical protein
MDKTNNRSAASENVEMQMANGKLQMADGKGRMADGKWKIENDGVGVLINFRGLGNSSLLRRALDSEGSFNLRLMIG